MDLPQARILIDKINALFKGMDGSNNALSAIERDLMLGYIRQLYEVFLNVRASQDAAKPVVRSTAEENVRPVMEGVAPKSPEPAPRQEPPQKVNTPPKIIEIPDSLKDLAPTQPPPPPPPKPAPPKQEPIIAKASPSVVASKNDGEYGVLFENKAAKELSEKLGERRVEDLGKAMAINDRLLYMNELFGRDAEALSETIKVLNRYENMDQAKGLIINLAEQYKWLEEDRLAIAQSFVKLVRRRYL